jgi:hypothetical protein
MKPKQRNLLGGKHRSKPFEHRPILMNRRNAVCADQRSRHRVRIVDLIELVDDEVLVWDGRA